MFTTYCVVKVFIVIINPNVGIWPIFLKKEYKLPVVVVLYKKEERAVFSLNVCSLISLMQIWFLFGIESNVKHSVEYRKIDDM